MRRLPIISVIPVSAAWLIIFLHSVIPHTHISDRPQHCSSVIHCCHDHQAETGSTGADGGRIVDSIADIDMHQSDSHNHFICHFTTAPFHPLDNIHPFYTDNKGITLDQLPAVPLTRNMGDEAFIPVQLSMHESLRAPPALRG